MTEKRSLSYGLSRGCDTSSRSTPSSGSRAGKTPVSERARPFEICRPAGASPRGRQPLAPAVSHISPPTRCNQRRTLTTPSTRTEDHHPTTRAIDGRHAARDSYFAGADTSAAGADGDGREHQQLGGAAGGPHVTDDTNGAAAGTGAAEHRLTGAQLHL